MSLKRLCASLVTSSAALLLLGCGGPSQDAAEGAADTGTVSSQAEWPGPSCYDQCYQASPKCPEECGVSREACDTAISICYDSCGRGVGPWLPC
jgi:hypothetical protein